MNKTIKRKKLLITGSVLVGASPLFLFAILLISRHLCSPQNLKGNEVCIPDPFLAGLILLAIPILIGLTLIVFAVFSKK